MFESVKRIGTAIVGGVKNACSAVVKGAKHLLIAGGVALTFVSAKAQDALFDVPLEIGQARIDAKVIMISLISLSAFMFAFVLIRTLSRGKATKN